MRVKLVINGNFPATLVLTIRLLTVPVVDNRAADIADVLVEAESTLLPVENGGTVVGMDTLRDRALTFADEAARHMVVTGTEDGKVKETTKGVDGLTSCRPAVTRMPVGTLAAAAVVTVVVNV